MGSIKGMWSCRKGIFDSIELHGIQCAMNPSVVIITVPSFDQDF